MNIIISEKQEQILINTMLQEAITSGVDYCEARLHIKKILDGRFIKGTISKYDEYGNPNNEAVVVMVDKDKKPIKPMTDIQLFEYLEAQPEIIDILPKEERTEFVKETMIAWYENRINKNGTIKPKG